MRELIDHTLKEENMVKEPRNKMQMENILIFRIKWKTMKILKNKKNKLNRKNEILRWHL